MDGQYNLLDYIDQSNNVHINPVEKIRYTPGQWIEKSELGKELTFDEITERVGKLIVMDLSTCSHEWYKVVQVEKIIPHEGARRLIYYDGLKQRGLVNEMYFSPEYQGKRDRAYELA